MLTDLTSYRIYTLEATYTSMQLRTDYKQLTMFCLESVEVTHASGVNLLLLCKATPRQHPGEALSRLPIAVITDSYQGFDIQMRQKGQFSFVLTLFIQKNI